MDGGDEKSVPLLALVREMSRELHPRQKADRPVTLDSGLEKDLGFDSLGRMELFSRVEAAFHVTLSDQAYNTIETPRDLLRVMAAGKEKAPLASPKAVPERRLKPVEKNPDQAETLVDVLKWHVKNHGDRPHVILLTEGDAEEAISYRRLHDEAEVLAAGLAASGFQTGQSAAIMLPTGKDYLFTFFAILMAGGIPVPIYPPVRKSQIEEHLKRHAAILTNARASVLVAFPEVKTLGRLLSAQVPGLNKVVNVEELRSHKDPGARPVLKGEEIALLQYTSGSTGTPKGVVLTHADLLANIRIMGRATEVTSSDVFVSWLPLYHDMGLIGAWLGSLYFAMPLVLMSPLSFLVRPERWLWAIHRRRATISAGPNFAYELCLAKINEGALEGLDLSSLRLATNGAEPVSPETINRFVQRFSKYRFRPEAMSPVYGLAECAVGLAFPPLGRGPKIDIIKRDVLNRSGRAVAASEQDTDPLRVVSCGLPLPGYQVRIVDEKGREAADREVGQLEFKGPSTTSGYFRNPEETNRLFNGEWLRSGDRAYMADGEIYLTGRDKDTIIRAGRNLYPYELEEAVGNLKGIRKGCVAVFGTTDPASATEQLIVLAEIREKDSVSLDALKVAIEELSIDLLGTPPEEIVFAPPHTVLKTSSGKIRRSACRELYESGETISRELPVWRQVLRVAGAAVKPQLRRLRGNVGALFYAGYAWTLFTLFAATAWIGLWLIPGITPRRAFLHRWAGNLIKMTGTPLAVGGLENLPPRDPVVVVSNHSSYLDSFILAAVLPPRFGFVAKRELLNRFASRTALRRIGTLFVERFDKTRGLADSQAGSQVLRKGESLIFFPEGTLVRMSGLLPFYMGAFVAAAETATPVVAVTIRGTRSMLRGGQWFPRRGAVQVTVGKPIQVDGRNWSAALELRNKTREEILSRCGEPDLTDQDYPRLEKP